MNYKIELNKETFKKLIKQGVDVSQYLILNYLNLNLNIQDLKELPKFVGIVSIMIRKELIVELENKSFLITEKGKELLNLFSKEEDTPVVLNNEYTIETVHRNVIAKLKELTGKSQIMADVKGSKHAFMLSNLKDFKERLEKYVIFKYNLTDLKKVEKCLIQHVITCFNSNRWTPLIKYYIFKDDAGSRLASDYETIEEKDEIVVVGKVENTKSLF